jgi:uncharacterized protein (TIGR03435 family)
MRRIVLFLSAALVMTGQAFDVASIRPSQTPQGKGLPSLREDINTSPGTLRMQNVTLTTTIRWAYKLNVYEVTGPDWLSNSRYDITAKADTAASEDQLRVMLRALLAERFKLLFHRQPKELSAFVFVIGKDVSKLHPAKGGGEGSMTGAALVFEGHKMPLSRLADIVSSALKMPVLDKTGLEGYYDFKLDLRPYITPPQPGDPPLDLTDIATSALRDQLGIKLESRKVTLEVLVVDSAERTPTED